MRFAYADPPYPGKSGVYRDHPDYAGEVDHAELVARLTAEFPEGWALSTSAEALQSFRSRSVTRRGAVVRGCRNFVCDEAELSRRRGDGPLAFRSGCR